MNELIAKRQSRTITEDELQELIRIIDGAERLNFDHRPLTITYSYLSAIIGSTRVARRAGT